MSVLRSLHDNERKRFYSLAAVARAGFFAHGHRGHCRPHGRIGVSGFSSKQIFSTFTDSAFVTAAATAVVVAAASAALVAKPAAAWMHPTHVVDVFFGDGAVGVQHQIMVPQQPFECFRRHIWKPSKILNATDFHQLNEVLLFSPVAPLWGHVPGTRLPASYGSW